MSKGSSINRNKIIEEGVLKQQGIKNKISKSMDKYSRPVIFGENIAYYICYIKI